MRPSPFRHTLAVLRTAIGLTQKEMASLLGCSTPTIQAIELAKLTLSTRLAEKIALKTGVSLTWLLQNDTTLPPDDVNGRPYSKAIFEQVQALEQGPANHPQDLDQCLTLTHVNLARMTALLLKAYKENKLNLAAYKIAKAFVPLLTEFNVSQEDMLNSLAPFSGKYRIPPEYRKKLRQLKGDRGRMWIFARLSLAYTVIEGFERDLSAAFSDRAKRLGIPDDDEFTVSYSAEGTLHKLKDVSPENTSRPQTRKTKGGGTHKPH